MQTPFADVDDGGIDDDDDDDDARCLLIIMKMMLTHLGGRPGGPSRRTYESICTSQAGPPTPLIGLQRGGGPS